VWGKKVEKDVKVHGEAAIADDALKRRRQEQLRELEKAKRARVEREAEREAWEKEKEMLEREREQMAYYENEKREEQFQLKQSSLRARIRVGEGRAKPIDLVADTLALLDPDMDGQTASNIKPEVGSHRRNVPASKHWSDASCVQPCFTQSSLGPHRRTAPVRVAGPKRPLRSAQRA
jgi:hypothetical protein